MSHLLLNGSNTLSQSSIPNKSANSPSPEFLRKLNNLKGSITYAKNTPVDSYLNYLCQKGRVKDAVVALDFIDNSKSKISPATFINLLQSCINSNSVSLGREIHKRINLVQERTLQLETKLVGMYAKCGAMKDARKVFHGMRERDLYSWSAMVGGYSRDRQWNEVIKMFYMMIEDNVIPDAFLTPKILQACGNSKDLQTGQLIHTIAVKCGFSAYSFVGNAVMSAYAKCGKLDMARKVFDTMFNRDIVAWNGLISGYCGVGNLEEARRLVKEMHFLGFEPSQTTWNILIAGLFQMGDCVSAMNLMKTMEAMGTKPDVVTWASMISGLSQNSNNKLALLFFKEMVCRGTRLSFISISCAISACISIAEFCMGKQIHCLAIKLGFVRDVLVGNAVIDLYSKMGDLKSARRIFDAMNVRDVYSWNTMIAGYCKGGFCGQACMLFIQMQESDVAPDSVTWNTLISGYIENRDDEQAVVLFEKMGNDLEVKRDTASWNSLISGYLQIGWKNMAVNIFRKMQSLGFTPNAVTILSLLPACANLLSFMKVKEVHGFVLRANLDRDLSIVNSLIETYGKSGNLPYAETLFSRVSSRDFITFHSLISGYVLHGYADAALNLADQMENLGFKPTFGSIACIILACGMSGMVDAGKQVFSLMREPGMEHYSAMVNLYGRSGMIKDAVKLIERISMAPNSSVWYALLTACRVHGNIEMATHAAENILKLEPNNHLVRKFLTMADDMCSKAASSVRCLGKEKGMTIIGQSRIIVKNVVHSFNSCEKSSSISDTLMNWILRTEKEAQEYDSSLRFCVDGECEEDNVGMHSEKLAMAYAFTSSASAPRCIRIMKNYRMCGECHEMAKYVSYRYGCEIYVSDAKSFHYFKSGNCSCCGYW